MLKTTWTYIALGLIAAVAGVGAFYYMTQTTVEQHVPAAAAAPPPPAPKPAQDDDLKRKTLEGIGSIKKLKPVPLEPTPHRQ